MSFKIKSGLFNLDIIDHYAILGLPISAEPKEIRPRYLKVVQKLHPDTSRIDEEKEKNLANQILSKLVNPAYEELSKEATRKEYQLLLSETSRSLAYNSNSSTENNIENQLKKAGVNFEKAYRKLVENIATEQYNSLEEVEKKVAQISELNLIYLKVRPELEELVKARAKIAVHQEKSVEKTPEKPPIGEKTKAPTPTINRTEAEAPPQSSPPPKAKEAPPSRVPGYLKRAQEMIEKNNFDRAILDLKDAIKLEPENASCHGLIGLAYLKLGQMGMAKVHIRKAMELSPKDTFAKLAQEEFDKLTPSAKKPDKAKPQDKQAKDSKDSKDPKSPPTIFGMRLW